MTNEQAKAVFNQIAAQHRASGKHDQAARIEIAREYFTNPKFKAAFEQHVWDINEAAR
jgi:hypothetical protein